MRPKRIQSRSNGRASFFICPTLFRENACFPTFMPTNDGHSPSGAKSSSVQAQASPIAMSSNREPKATRPIVEPATSFAAC